MVTFSCVYIRFFDDIHPHYTQLPPSLLLPVPFLFPQSLPSTFVVCFIVYCFALSSLFCSSYKVGVLCKVCKWQRFVPWQLESLLRS
jgi:hypothetical protein